MELVLSEALAHNFKVYVYVLAPEHNGTAGRAQQVQSRLPQGVRLTRILDATRFAHLNAATINADSSIVG